MGISWKDSKNLIGDELNVSKNPRVQDSILWDNSSPNRHIRSGVVREKQKCNKYIYLEIKEGIG
jgi:hypothetical protein